MNDNDLCDDQDPRPLSSLADPYDPPAIEGAVVERTGDVIEGVIGSLPTPSALQVPEAVLALSGWNGFQYESPLQRMLGSDRPGILIEWERRSTASVATYAIQRAPHLAGPYETVAVAPFPEDQFLDTDGRPGDYYRILEQSPDGETINVGKPLRGEEMLLKMDLQYEVSQLLLLRVRDEEAMYWDPTRTSTELSFHHWNAKRPEVSISSATSDGAKGARQVLSEDTPITSTIDGNTPNYPDGLTYKLDWMGRVYFLKGDGITPQPIQEYDTVMVTYWVRTFTPTEMNQAMRQALSTIIAQPGTNKYASVGMAPPEYLEAIVAGAAYYLLRRLLVSLNNREFRLLLQDPENSFNSVQELRENAKMYKEDFDNFLKIAGKSRYARSRTIVNETHQMPGGRSSYFRQNWKSGQG